MKNLILISSLILGCATFGCGEKSGPTLSTQVSFMGANPFERADLNDVVVLVENVQVEGLPILDGHGGAAPDQQPDTIVYPAACVTGSTPLAAGCGYPKADVQSQIELTGVPLGYAYKLRLQGRDSAGTVLFSGESTVFTFDEQTSVVPPIVL